MAGMADSLMQLTTSASSHDAALHQSCAQITAVEVPNSEHRLQSLCAHALRVEHFVPRFWYNIVWMSCTEAFSICN